MVQGWLNAKSTDISLAWPEFHFWTWILNKSTQKDSILTKETAMEEPPLGGAAIEFDKQFLVYHFQVVDMTGPETKILTGYGSIAQQHAKPGEVPPTTSGWLSYTLIISRLLQGNLF